MFIAFCSLAAVSDDLHQQFANAIRAAIARSYPSMQAACVDMADDGLTPVTASKVASVQANFSKELSGERTLRLQPLMRLNAQFRCWLPLMLVKEFGMPEDVTSAASVSNGLKRMARAELLSDVRRESTAAMPAERERVQW